VHALVGHWQQHKIQLVPGISPSLVFILESIMKTAATQPVPGSGNTCCTTWLPAVAVPSSSRSDETGSWIWFVLLSGQLSGGTQAASKQDSCLLQAVQAADAGWD
jgi:hypothetical protein